MQADSRLANWAASTLEGACSAGKGDVVQAMVEYGARTRSHHFVEAAIRNGHVKVVQALAPHTPVHILDICEHNKKVCKSVRFPDLAHDVVVCLGILSICPSWRRVNRLQCRVIRQTQKPQHLLLKHRN